MDLEKISGLPLDYSEGKLTPKSGAVHVPKPDFRTLEDARPVLMNPDAKGPKKLYEMYRNIHFKKNAQLLKTNHLRYDITIIPPGRIGEEFVKTVGHIHSKVRGTNKTYPEIYEVLHGDAIFFFQKMENKNVTDVIAYSAEPGDKVVVPPNYGHITINPSRKTLVMSNFMCTLATSKYGPIKTNKGGTHYYTGKFVKNLNYKNHPKVRKLKPKKLTKFGIPDGPMYLSCIANNSLFDFLLHPQNYRWD